MVAKRVIPCLDVDKGRVVKGVSFRDLRGAGDPVELAARYVQEGADELVFLDVSASVEGRRAIVEVVRRVAEEIDIPFTVGGGVRTLEDAEALLRNGADKVSVNTMAVEKPELISKIARRYGDQCVVVAIDAAREHSSGDSLFRVYTHSGTRPTKLDAVEWARRAAELGAGELLVTSIDRDGRQQGYDVELLSRISKSVSVPVIASGGAGALEDFYAAISAGGADAVLAASVFHYRTFSIKQVKEHLMSRGIEVRL
ncbi:MAG: imidazole glycerol phosphate synthase subunit HisF [Thaumarchaeota archaeon]|nr:imidazole glycerol phosphate synthase subunit HisF [Candidatus Calditenuaceae archaeon]MDW8187270.1 imidazole glycerol phosphate synthase subunit HisF [Nitrososphaerota archaeon]